MWEMMTALVALPLVYNFVYNVERKPLKACAYALVIMAYAYVVTH